MSTFAALERLVAQVLELAPEYDGGAMLEQVAVDADVVFDKIVEFYLAQVEARLADMGAVFPNFDKDQSGELDLSEFQAVFTHFTGGRFSAEEQLGIFKEMLAVEGDPDDPDSVDAATFAQVCHKHGIYMYHDAGDPNARPDGLFKGRELCKSEFDDIALSLNTIRRKLKISGVARAERESAKAAADGAGALEAEPPAADEDASSAPSAETAIGSMTKEERRATDERVSSLLMGRVTELLGKMAECDFKV